MPARASSLLCGFKAVLFCERALHVPRGPLALGRSNKSQVKVYIQVNRQIYT